MDSHASSNTGAEGLPEQFSQSCSQQSMPAEPTPSLAPPSEGKNDVADVSRRSPDASREQLSSGGSTPTGNDARQTTSIDEYNEDDLELVLRLSQLPADTFDEQLSEINQRRESGVVDEDDLQTEPAYEHFWMGLIGFAGLSPHDSYLEALVLAQRGASLLEQYKASGVLVQLEEGHNALSNANQFLPQSHPMKPRYLNCLGTSFQRRFERLGDLVDLNEAIQAQQQAVHLTPQDHPDMPRHLNDLGDSFLHRFRRLGNLVDLDEAIIAQQGAADLTPDGHPHKPAYLTNLGLCFQNRFQRLDQLVNLDEAIVAQQEAVHLIPDSNPDKPACISNLGISFQDRYRRLGNLVDLNEAITAHQHVVRLTPHGHPNKPRYLNNLGISLKSRFERLDDVVDLDEAITAQEQAVHLAPQSHPEMPRYLINLGISFQNHFERLGDVVDLDKAITIQQQAVLLTPDSHPDKPGHLNNLGSSFNSRFGRLGDIVDLHEAITAQQQAVHLIPDDHPLKRACLNNLGNSLRDRFHRLGDLVDLDEAITAQQEAIRLIPDDHPVKPGCFSNLGSSFRCRFERLGNLVDLDEAIAAQRQAARTIPDWHSFMPGSLHNLGTTLQRRFERLGDVADLDDAIAAQQQAVRLTPDDHPSTPTHLGGLGNSFQFRFDRFGNIVDLDEAIMAKRDAVHLTPDNHPEKPEWLSGLGSSLLSRFERLGDVVDIDEAITAQRHAVRLTPDSHSTHLSNLGSSFFRRFERLGNVVDLDEAITAQQQAVRLTPDGHQHKPTCLSNLGTFFQCRFGHLDNPLDLAEAITANQQALRLTPDGHPNRPGFLDNLGNALHSRFVHSGLLSDLGEAISARQHAVRLTPNDHPHKPRHLSNLGSSLRRRFEHLGNVVDIAEAITAQQQALHLTPNGHPAKATCHNDLGRSFCARFDRRRDIADLAQALSVFSQSAKCASGQPSARFESARSWATICFRLRSDEALDAYSILFDLIPRVVWLGKTIEQRYRDISTISDAISEAATAALSLGKPHWALEWLEQGRSIVWGQILQLRTPLNDLRRHYPDEANRLEKISHALEFAGAAQGPKQSGLSSSDTSQTLEEVAQAHRRLAEEYERLVGYIRGLPGFGGFLAPQNREPLWKAAVSGPIIVVNADEVCCNALIVLPNSSRLSRVALPGLRISDVSRMRDRLAGLIQGTHITKRACGPYDSEALPRWDEDMTDILGQLWAHIVEPILRCLKMLKRPAADKMPHITWCLTGRLTFLPIHAAGLYGKEDQPKLFDYVVSSYTPTLTALLSSQHLPARRRGEPRILAVSQPEAQMQQFLPGTALEIKAIEALQSQTPGLRVTALTGEEATVEAVLQSMKDSNWVHLACHGIQDPITPTDSAFIINGRLMLNEIMKQSFPRTELAFLSACQTAKGDSKLPEEAIHLAAGMLMAGCGSVVGTMWSIRDDDAPIVAEKFYSYLVSKGGGDGTKAAYALHHAVAHLRNSGCGFDRWVPFIHLGVCSPPEPSTSTVG